MGPRYLQLDAPAVRILMALAAKAEHASILPALHFFRKVTPAAKRDAARTSAELSCPARTAGPTVNAEGAECRPCPVLFSSSADFPVITRAQLHLSRQAARRERPQAGKRSEPRLAPLSFRHFSRAQTPSLSHRASAAGQGVPSLPSFKQNRNRRRVLAPTAS